MSAFPATTPVEIEKATGGSMKLNPDDRETVSRGGKGFELWKRGAVKRVVMPEPALPNLEAVAEAEGTAKKKVSKKA